MKTVSGSYFSFSNLCFEPSDSTNGLALRILYDKNKSASLNEKERERERACVSEKESEYLYQKECMWSDRECVRVIRERMFVFLREGGRKRREREKNGGRGMGRMYGNENLVYYKVTQFRWNAAPSSADTSKVSSV